MFFLFPLAKLMLGAMCIAAGIESPFGEKNPTPSVFQWASVDLSFDTLSLHNLGSSTKTFFFNVNVFVPAANTNAGCYALRQ